MHRRRASDGVQQYVVAAPPPTTLGPHNASSSSSFTSPRPTTVNLDNYGADDYATTTTTLSSPDTFEKPTASKTHTKAKLGKLWSTVKQNAKLLASTTTPSHNSTHNQRRRASLATLTPRNLSTDLHLAHHNGTATTTTTSTTSTTSASMMSKHHHHASSQPETTTTTTMRIPPELLDLDGLDAKSLGRRRTDLEKLKKEASYRLHGELLKHQKQLILTSELIADLHKTLGSLRKCVTTMKKTLPVYQSLKSGVNLEALEARDEASLRGGNGANGEAEGDRPSSPSRASPGGPPSSSVLRAAAGQELAALVGILGDSPPTAASASEVQARILALCSDLLEDPNAGEAEILHSARCISLVTSPHQARRLLLQRYARGLEAAMEMFRARGKRWRPSKGLLRDVGALLATFLHHLARAAKHCAKLFGSENNRWSSDLMCWCLEEAQVFAAEIQKRCVTHVTLGGGIKEIVEVILVILIECRDVGEATGIGLVLIMEEKLASMLMTVIGVYTPRIGRDVALQATSEIAHFVQLLDDAKGQSNGAAPNSPLANTLVSFNGLSQSSGMIARTLEDLLRSVRPMLSHSLHACISDRMFFLFKQYVSTIGDSVKRYSNLISEEAARANLDLLEAKRKEMLGNVRGAAAKIIQIRGEGAAGDQITGEIDRFDEIYCRVFHLPTTEAMREAAE